MACERFADDLRAHASGADPSRELRAHLDGCVACRQRLAHERKLVATIDSDLADALGVKPSGDFRARVRERIAQENVGSGFSRIWPRWQFALGAATLLLIAAIGGAIALRTTTAPEHAQSPRPGTNTEAVVRPPQPHVTAPSPERTLAPVAMPPGVEVPGVAGGLRANGGRAAARAEQARPLRLRTREDTEPEVLVPPDQRIALNRLLNMMATGKIDQALLPPVAEPEVAPPAEQVVAPLVVQDLKVPPIDVTAGSTEKRDNRRP